MPNSKKNAGSEPKLLSGGNPQIPKGEGDEPVQANIAAGIGSAVNDTTREVGTALGIAVFGSVVNPRTDRGSISPASGCRWNTEQPPRIRSAVPTRLRTERPWVTPSPSAPRPRSPMRSAVRTASRSPSC